MSPRPSLDLHFLLATSRSLALALPAPPAPSLDEGSLDEGNVAVVDPEPGRKEGSEAAGPRTTDVYQSCPNPAIFRFSLLRRSLIPSFQVLVSSILLLATSHSPLATVPISSLESALTSHFATKFDLKSFRMRTYVTPGGRGVGAPSVT